MMKKNEEYAAHVSHALASLFDPENEHHALNLETVDATEFFIGLVKGSALFYNRLTSDNKSFLEYTHLCNQLIFQDAVHSKKEGN